MPTNDKGAGRSAPAGIDLKEEDIYEAMRKIPGYLDITPGDFKEIYLLAYQQAVARLQRQVTAEDVMTREVVAVRPDTPLAEVAEAMGHKGISGVPVVDEAGRLAGVISEKDFLRQMGVTGPQNFMALVASCLRGKGCVALPIKKQKAQDLMSTPAVTVSPETPLKKIAEICAARKINRVPVTDAAGHLQGIVTRGDLVKATGGGSES